MRLIFCGTPEFAVPTLERLIQNRFTIDSAVTNPDEPSGRGYELKASPVKQTAVRAGLAVFQPARLKDPATVNYLSRFEPDAIVVVAYGHLIPEWLINLPRLGCINLHASLLPKYRGAAPIQWALVRGETVTGVTTMRIDEGLDTGPILLKKEVGIQDEDTTETLSERLSQVGADLMVSTLERLEHGDLEPVTQDHTQATRAPILKKQDGRIDWTLPAKDIWNRVRGLRPWPGAYTTFRGKRLHVWRAARPDDSGSSPLAAGFMHAERGRLFVTCGQGTRLEAAEVQLEGRKCLAARDFLNGAKLLAGERFI